MDWRKLSVAQIVCAVGASAPFLLAVGAHLREAAPQLAIESEQRPALVFHQYLVDHGAVSPREVIPTRFRFTNASDRTVRVGTPEPSCGCLQPQLEKRVYEPGETGELILQVRTEGQPSGSREYFVDIPYDDGQPRSRRLMTRFELPERRATVHPKAMIFYQSGNFETSREVIVSDDRDKPLNVFDVKCESPYVELTWNPGHDDEISRAVIQITIVERIATPIHDTHVTVLTDDEDYPRLYVPIRIHGPPESPADQATETER